MGSSLAFLGQTPGDTFLQSFWSAYFPFLSFPLVSKVSLQRETGPSSCSTSGQAELHQPPSPPIPLPERSCWLTDGLADSAPLPSLPTLPLLCNLLGGPIYSLGLHRWMISGVLVCWVDNFFFFFFLVLDVQFVVNQRGKQEGTTHATMMLTFLLNYLFKAPYFIFALQSFQSTHIMLCFKS